MFEVILQVLQTLGIEVYSITQTQSESVECFFVRRHLDLKRGTNLTDYQVTVYRPFEKDGQKMLGSSAVPVYAGMEEEELRQALASAYHAASFVCNPYYELYAGQKEPFAPSKSAFAGMSLESSLKTMAEALFASDTEDTVFINSAEIFAIRKINRVVNSSGVDVSWQTDEVKGEYVIQCLAPNDVETYHSFSYREPDAEALRADVAQSMAQTRDRAAAAAAPKAGAYTVILSAAHVRELLSFYLNRSASRMIYQKYSGYKVGQAIQGEEIQGDPLTIVLKTVDPYDGEGIPMRDRVLVENGTLKTIHGGSRFAYYLGMEPTGQYQCISVPVGQTPLSEMKSKPYLHIVSFSDFQMDSFSGHFAGEIRLAYLYDGNTVTPVTGGSVNGSLLDTQGQLVFSKERYVSGNYEGPFAVCIPNVQIAGEENA